MDRLLLDKWLRFLATTNGRDKVYRVVQYASKLMAHYLLRLDRKSPVGARLLLLSVALGQGRKRTPSI
jgi:peroxin-11B